MGRPDEKARDVVEQQPTQHVVRIGGELYVEHVLTCAETGCGSRMRLRGSRHGLFYGCELYPACRGTHGAHARDGAPKGVPGNARTKRSRERAHAYFDELWVGRRRFKKRWYAYAWLARTLGMTQEECHIGAFDEENCRRVWRAAIAETSLDVARATAGLGPC